MKAIESANYDREFPETFTWGHLYTISLSNAATMIVNHIEHDFRKDRNLVPGLRAALNIIAEMAEV